MSRPVVSEDLFSIMDAMKDRIDRLERNARDAVLDDGSGPGVSDSVTEKSDFFTASSEWVFHYTSDEPPIIQPVVAGRNVRAETIFDTVNKVVKVRFTNPVSGYLLTTI